LNFANFITISLDLMLCCSRNPFSERIAGSFKISQERKSFIKIYNFC